MEAGGLTETAHSSGGPDTVRPERIMQTVSQEPEWREERDAHQHSPHLTVSDLLPHPYLSHDTDSVHNAPMWTTATEHLQAQCSGLW